MGLFGGIVNGIFNLDEDEDDDTVLGTFGRGLGEGLLEIGKDIIGGLLNDENPDDDPFLTELQEILWNYRNNFGAYSVHLKIHGNSMKIIAYDVNNKKVGTHVMDGWEFTDELINTFNNQTFTMAELLDEDDTTDEENQNQENMIEAPVVATIEPQKEELTIEERLTKLKSLFDSGIIDEEEYKEKRKELIALL